MNVTRLNEEKIALVERIKKKELDFTTEVIKKSYLDEFCAENKINYDFEISAVKYPDGSLTGLASCSKCAEAFEVRGLNLISYWILVDKINPKQKNNGHPYFLCSLEKSNGFRKPYLINHLNYHHLSKLTRQNRKRQNVDDVNFKQLSIKRVKALDKKEKDRIRQAHMDFLCEANLPLQTFESEEWQKFVKVLWEESTTYFEDYKSIPVSTRKYCSFLYSGALITETLQNFKLFLGSTKRKLKSSATSKIEKLAEQMQTLAHGGYVSLLVDHHQVRLFS